MHPQTAQLPLLSSNGSAAVHPGESRSRAERWFRRPAVLLRTILALTFAAYLQTIGFAFVSDDWHLIPSNAWMASWRSVPRFFTQQMWAFSDFHFDANFYRPVFMLWLFLIDHATGGAPGWFHLATILLHLIAVAEVFVLARMLTRDDTIALLAALIFALHPGKVEVVAWISGMTELLCAVFLFGAVICWLRWRDNDRKIWLFGALGTLALALLSKESAILIPLLFAIYEWYGGEGSLARVRHVVSRVWPFVALAAVYLSWRFYVLHGLSENSLAPSPKSLLGAPLVFAWYIRHLIWPVGLSFLYDPAAVEHPGIAWLVATTLAAAGAAVVIYRSIPDRAPRALLLWWFPLLLAPAAASFSILQTHDRYLYVPSFALAVALACLLVSVPRSGAPAAATVRIALVGALLIALVAGTIREAQSWEDDISLGERAVQVAPSFPLVYCSLAAVYLDNGRENDARRVASETTLLFPNWIQGWEVLGRLDYMQGDLKDARAAFTRGLATPYETARKDFSLYSLGLIAQKQGDLRGAANWYRQSLAANPTSAGARQALTIVLSLEASDKPSSGTQPATR